MADQAAGLRSLFARRRPSLLIVSGSDAAKPAVAAHFARESAAAGRATVLVDGTPGQVAAACDVACRYELAHVLAGDKALVDVARPIADCLLLLPAARALSRFGAFTPDEDARLADAFSNGIAAALVAAGVVEPQVDLIVVHAADGQAARAVDAFGRDARVVIVASDRASAMRGAYAEMKTLAAQGLENFEIVAPCHEAGTASGVAFANLSSTARRFLEIELVDGGTVVVPRPEAAVSGRSASTTRAAFAGPGASSGRAAHPMHDGSTLASIPDSTNTPPAEVHHVAVA